MHQLSVGTHAIVAGNWDAVYARYLKEILQNGDTFVGRNGETRAMFGSSVMVDLQHGFPLTRLRKMPVQNVFRELLFDLGLSGNIEALGKAKHFWSFLADENGELGATAYNRQWRRFPPSDPQFARPGETFFKAEVDQVKRAILQLRMNPYDRQATIITTNPTAIRPSCPPCHLCIQLMARPNGTLDMMVPARSNDMIVGFPLDIARYAMMTHIFAKATGMLPGRLFMPSSNSHIYENCYGIAEELISREVREECQFTVKDSWSQRGFDIDQLYIDDFSVIDYNPHEAIKVEVN